MANVRKQLVTEQKTPGTQFVLIEEARIGYDESYECETEDDIDDVFEKMFNDQFDPEDMTVVVYKRYMICRRRVTVDKETISE